MSQGGLVDIMTQTSVKKIWKIRTIKNYPEAHNHLCVGEVVNIGDSYVRLKCRTYHFGRNLNGPRDVRVGETGFRIIPWSRIEIINELEATFNYEQAKLNLEQNGVVLSDGKFSYAIASSYDSRY